MNALKQGILLTRVLIASGLLLVFSPKGFSACDYVVSKSTGPSFSALIRLTNNTSNTVDGWNVRLHYNDGSRVIGGRYANITDTAPYIATPLSWNSTIEPGQVVEFEIRGTNGGFNPQTPILKGNICRETGFKHFTSSSSGASLMLSDTLSTGDVSSSSTNSITIQENTSGFCGVDGSVDSNNAGFTGDGFANTDNASTKGINWAMNGDAGSYTFSWRFSNGSSTNRTGVLSVNGARVVAQDFNETGAWTTWAVSSVSVNLSGGLKFVRLEADQGEGLSNIDHIEISGPGVSVASCDDDSGSSSSSSSSSSGAGRNVASLAVASTSYVSSWETLDAVNDNSNPSSSNDKSNGAYGNWNNPNSIQWVRYDWSQNYTLTGTEVYWFDDDGGVLVPTIAYIEYWNDGAWVRGGNVPLAENAFNYLGLAGVTTNRLRVSMLNPQESTGILEWRVFGNAASGGSSSSSSTGGPVPYRPITSEYVHLDVTPSNGGYTDSDRFRTYSSKDGRSGGQNNLAVVNQNTINTALEHLEAAYECFVNDWGFRSASLRLNNDSSPYYKLNVYNTTTLTSAGAMGADWGMGLCFIELRDSYIGAPSVVTHEYGHCLNYSAYRWNDQNSTGAWWESVANWFADTYQTDPLCENVRAERGLPVSMDTIINLEVNIVQSWQPIVDTANYYQAWPFLTYIANNPDNYDGLGRLVLKNMFDNHLRNDETPLHVLERLTPVSVQNILGRYWARMAYLDINHPKAQAKYFNAINGSAFNSRAFANLDGLGGRLYRVKPGRQPQYGGANIIPLTLNGNGGTVSVTVTNLGNGLSGSNFTATLSIRNTTSGKTRYVTLQNGKGEASVSSVEEVSLVVANTPNQLIQFNAFESNGNSPDQIGLNYEVEINGAFPSH